MTFPSLARAIQHLRQGIHRFFLKSRVNQALIGSAQTVDFIPSRPYIVHVPCGYEVMRYVAWSDPFWSVTVLTEQGSYLHACLHRHSCVPDIGSPVSFVAKKPWPWSKEPNRIEALLRPPADLFQV